MKLVVMVVVAAGCGGKPPAATTVTNAHADEAVGQLDGTPLPSNLSAPRPDLAISALMPDPTEEARWPLTMAAHPVLEPHFDIAGALAEPGVGWLELCGRGIQLRRLPGNPDLGDYLRAWCAVANHSTKDALYRLGQLHTSTVNGLANAVKHDCANILADHGPAGDLQSILSYGQLHDVELLDLTSASYFEVNRNEDAFDVNKIAIDVDRAPSHEVMCHRLVRGIVVGNEYQRETLYTKLHGLTVQKDPNLKVVVDPVCEMFEHEVHCWLDPRRGCTDYLHDQHRSYQEVALFDAYQMWPTLGGTAEVWSAVAKRAETGAPADDAYRLALPALELAVRTSKCETQFLNGLASVARRLTKYPDHNPAFDPALAAFAAEHDRLVTMALVDCQQVLGGLPPVVP